MQSRWDVSDVPPLLVAVLCIFPSGGRLSGSFVGWWWLFGFGFWLAGFYVGM
jgi:nucleoside recognition membrane protein YjiH